jgi:choline dehydrogenase-like flavoprotein
MMININIENPDQQEWDIIIVGTGIAGATIGYALAKAGKRVLFCEKGKSYLTDHMAIRGNYAESFFPRPEVPQLKHRDILKRAGRYTDEIIDESNVRNNRFIPFIGSGTGGSSALYGMALERFFPSDFTPGSNYPDAKDANLPDHWPITYEDLIPYYETAEKLYRVRGTADPFRVEESLNHFLAPPPFSPGTQELFNFLTGKGLNPYHLPLACEYVPDCECCQGYLCRRECKNDSVRICLEPALAEFGAYLLDECEIIRLDATRDEITEVICFWKGRELKMKASIIVLAAGALETPRILLSSSSQTWSNGLANESGLVGRNLMRHYVDLFAISLKTREKFPVSFKEIAFNDFYVAGEQKFGSVQSFGALPPPSIIVEDMEKELCESSFPLTGSLFKLAKPFVRLFLKNIISRRLMLATIMEDLPFRNNLVMLSNSNRNQIIIKYQISDHERHRIEAFRKAMQELLEPYKFMLIKAAENNKRIAHACGTCRFGTDPSESVLNSNNRAHGLSNLYVVDSSFFPSSGGTNPGLTIAANALRVADHILAKVD